MSATFWGLFGFSSTGKLGRRVVSGGNSGYIYIYYLFISHRGLFIYPIYMDGDFTSLHVHHPLL